MVHLEQVLHRHNMSKDKPTIDNYKECFEINIISKSIPKVINIGKKNTLVERRNIKNVICDVFA